MKTDRPADEILTQIRALDDEGGDMFGVIRGHLMECLPYEVARQHLKPEVTEEMWRELTEVYETPKQQAHAYMPFAASKIVGERGLSSARNIDHMRALVYLHAGQAALDELEATDYGWYGREQMTKAAEILGLSGEWAGILALEEGAE
jgi:hypothetical protein